MGVLVVTGTGTGVGKTVTTAAVAAVARSLGESVVAVKPAQTGAASGEPGDLAEIRRLSGIEHTVEFARFPGALSPEAAARDAGMPPLDLRQAADRVGALADTADRVLVEGAGGLLVRYGPDGSTLADLAYALAAPVLVVIAAGLGTLNHTALTLEALSARGLKLAGLVIGSWPVPATAAERHNLVDLAVIAGEPLTGAITAGAGSLSPAEFSRRAGTWLAPCLGGSFDPRVFSDEHLPEKERR